MRKEALQTDEGITGEVSSGKNGIERRKDSNVSSLRQRCSLTASFFRLSFLRNATYPVACSNAAQGVTDENRSEGMRYLAVLGSLV